MVVIGIIYDSLNDSKQMLQIAEEDFNQISSLREFAYKSYREEQNLMIIYIVCFVF